MESENIIQYPTNHSIHRAIRISQEAFEWLEDIAKAKNISFNSAVNECIQQAMNKE